MMLRNQRQYTVIHESQKYTCWPAEGMAWTMVAESHRDQTNKQEKDVAGGGMCGMFHYHSVPAAASSVRESEPQRCQNKEESLPASPPRPGPHPHPRIASLHPANHHMPTRTMKRGLEVVEWHAAASIYFFSPFLSSQFCPPRRLHERSFPFGSENQRSCPLCIKDEQGKSVFCTMRHPTTR
jgi:hypothetical protein